MKKCNAEIIKKFQKGLLTRRVLLGELSKFILNEPKYHGYFDDDIRNEFFALVASKIEKLLQKYKEIETADFTTWFSHVLRNEFFGFIKRWNSVENYHSKEVYELNTICNNYNDVTENEESEDENKKIDYSFLTENERNILLLKYGLGSNKINIEETQSYIQDKLLLRKKYEELINKKFVKLIRLQKQIKFEVDKEKIKKLKEEEKEVLRKKRDYEYKYTHYNVFPSNKDVAQKLHYSIGTVSSYLNRIKLKFEKAGLDKITAIN